MPEVATTSVQLTTPMRMALQDAGSAAMALALIKAAPVRINNSLFMDEVSLGSFIVGSGVWRALPTTLPSGTSVNTTCGDRQLHWGDCEGLFASKPAPTLGPRSPAGA